MLDAGVAMLGASADDDLVPELFRVWGAGFDPATMRLRALVNADAGRTLERVARGVRLSLTFTDVTDFRSLQVKGACVGPPLPPGPDDVATMRRYGRRFEDSIVSVGHRPGLTDRLRPASVFVVEIEVDSAFDQTPGPGAGAAVPVPT
jgi:hypothetical protein